MLSALQLVPERPLLVAPDRFEPGGRLLGVSDENHCRVWKTDGGQYQGEYPAAACKSWPNGVIGSAASLRDLQPRELPADSNPIDSHLVSPTVQREAVWRGAELTIRTGAGRTIAAKYQPGGELASRPLTAVVWSPDGEQLAVAHNTDAHIFILRARDGVVVAELPLLPEESVASGLLVWGSTGLIAIVGPRSEPDPEPVALGSEKEQVARRKGPLLRAYYWSDLKATATTLPLDDIDTDNNAVVIDPMGRYLFLRGGADPSTGSVEGFDLRSGNERVFYGRSGRSEQAPSATVETYSTNWIPGQYPLWETVEVRTPKQVDEDEPVVPVYTTWRLYTVPRLDGPRLEQLSMSGPPRKLCERRRVESDGRTVEGADARDTYDSCKKNPIDPSGLLRGVAKDELQRISDGVRLRVGKKSCLQADSGYYSCLDLAGEQRYAIGTEPLRALFLRGDQLAPLFYRPELLTDFVKGREIPTPPRQSPLGLPPRLELLHVEATTNASVPVELTLRIENGGSGVGSLRVYRDYQLFGQPLPLQLGRQAVELPLLGGSCRKLLVQACNELGFVCTSTTEIDPCRSWTKDE